MFSQKQLLSTMMIYLPSLIDVTEPNLNTHTSFSNVFVLCVHMCACVCVCVPGCYSAVHVNNSKK